MKSKPNRSERVKKDTSWLNLKRVEVTLFYLLVFFLPTQLAYHFWPNFAFVFGVRVDYLAPAIFLTDLLVVGILVLWFVREKTFPKYLLAVFLFAFLNIILSVSPWASFWKWIKIIELCFFAFYVSKNKLLFQEKGFIKVLSISLVLISLIAIIQFLSGRTIGGPFYLLGERTFSISTPGIALENIFGREFLRPYSTFSHPNSLAGFLGLSMILFPGLLRKTFGIGALAFFISASLSAFSAALSAFLFKKVSKYFVVVVIVLSLLLPFINFLGKSEEVVERINLAQVAGEVISHNFYFGSGANTFVLQTPSLQPVHNIFLLILPSLLFTLNS